MRVSSAVLGLAAAHLSTATAARFNFINRCPFTVNMWDNSVITNITARSGVLLLDVFGKGLMWRHGYNPEATLAEVTVDQGAIWYDISVIPPGTGYCTSYDNCNDYKVAQGRRGFNVAMAMVPKANINGYNCRPIICLTSRCDDAFLYPTDNLKVQSCPDSTPFDIIFCPGGIVDTAMPKATVPPMPRATDPTTADTNNIIQGKPTTNANANAGNTNNTNNNNANNANANNNAAYTPAWFEYSDAQAGNVAGSYSRVTQLAGCQRARVDVMNPIGPLSEEVTMVFRGPMEIYNIAVFGGAPDVWPRLSWYKRGGQSANLLFFNNQNTDWSGQGGYGPQSFASPDGRDMSPTPTAFLGSLADASNPVTGGYGPGMTTGVEVNIMTAQPCGDNNCRGFSAGDYNYRGWSGDRKIFVTRVSMPMSGTTPNLPAIWMLNAQVMYTGQYNPCNCRGQGAAGGCGELDIAEVINSTYPRLDRISTHHYFYDGQVLNPPGGDDFASRPTNRNATYVTILDALGAGGDGLIKILEIDDSTFDFDADSITNAHVHSWIAAVE